MIGVCSYLLIGFWYHRLSATKSAVKAMLVNRVSDTFLFISIMLMWWYLGSTDYSIFLFNTKEAYYLDWICITMMLGAAGKSAQIGLHVWLILGLYTINCIKINIYNMLEFLRVPAKFKLYERNLRVAKITFSPI